MKILPLYTLYFFFYGFCGWVIESFYCSVGESRKAKKLVLVNRGFLTGPIVPIYGAGALGMIIALSPIATSYKNIWIVFLLGMLVCDIIEYVTSFAMEKIYHQRWWDYSNEFMNLHGRICLKHTIMWGFLSTAFIYLIHSRVAKLFTYIPEQKAYIILVTALILFFFDYLNTVSAIIDINKISAKAKNLIASVSDSSLLKNINERRFLSWALKILQQIDELAEQIETESFGSHKKHKIIHRILTEFPALRVHLKNQLESLNAIKEDIKDKISYSDDDDSNEMSK